MIYKTGDTFDEPVRTFPTEYTEWLRGNNWRVKGEVGLVEDNNGWQFLHILIEHTDGKKYVVPVGNYEDENDWCIYFC